VRKQTRNNLAKVIEAQPTIDLKLAAARFAKSNGKGRGGWRAPTEIEVKAEQHYLLRRELEQLLKDEKAGEPADDLWRRAGYGSWSIFIKARIANMEQLYRNSGRDLTGLFCDAINSLDSTPLRQLADVIDAYKADPTWAESEDEKLLMLKKLCDDTKQTMLLADVARFLNYTGDPSALGRRCRKLELPITPGKVGRPKIRANKRVELRSVS
jgi:hypothetical protein